MQEPYGSRRHMVVPVCVGGESGPHPLKSEAADSIGCDVRGGRVRVTRMGRVAWTSQGWAGEPNPGCTVQGLVATVQRTLAGGLGALKMPAWSAASASVQDVLTAKSK